ncbi:MAG: bifunctional folylpolyglutamate synthase/ dihydrofolate synthase [Methanomassiliicoccales archaeon PtaU1.Bin124]|nr:MAG: bifunctional folylpolyglutamate synthase/ dihydrofolate synthase [Methanomassiliicoccales archaeon PtaU1.Bin124]
MTDRYQETIDWLYSLENMGIKLGLERMRELLQALGDPQRSFRSVHIAGTNGKGSVCAMLSSIFREGGYRTGLYTSPHLVDFTERIQVDGVQISREEVAALAGEVRVAMETPGFPDGRKLTFFEVTTAIAFLHFARNGVEMAVVEVGMGGRLDATNVITPECCVITSLALEHTQYLGDTLPKIAYEKAGIIKEGVTVVSASHEEDVLRIIDAVARDRGSPLLVSGRDFEHDLLKADWNGTKAHLHSIGSDVTIPLLGGYQAANAAIACECALETAKRGVYLPEEAIARGLENVYWPGRMEVVSQRPLLVFDVTHTPAGAKAVAGELSRLQDKDWTLVIGVLNDKDLRGICEQFGPLAKNAVATSPHTKRAFSAEEVAAVLKDYCDDVEVVPEVPMAIERARTIAGQGPVLLTGSLYMVGEAKEWWTRTR